MSRYWYVAADGSSSNTGTIASPWSFVYAAAGAGGSIQPGDTVWLRGGTYNDPAASYVNNAKMWDVTVDGTAGNPITFRGYPGEWPVFDDHRGESEAFKDFWTLWISGDYLIFRDLECYCSFTDREQVLEAAMARGGQIAMLSKNGKLINVIGHDGMNAVFLSTVSENSEMIGNILFNNGSGAPLSGNGHSVYTQCLAGNTHLFQDCIFGGNYGYNWHAYAESAGKLDGFTLKDCTSVDGRVLWGTIDVGNATPGGADVGGNASYPMTNFTMDGHWRDGA